MCGRVSDNSHLKKKESEISNYCSLKEREQETVSKMAVTTTGLLLTSTPNGLTLWSFQRRDEAVQAASNLLKLRCGFL